jgi:16S rRNA (cytosine967-C5)-methyltransferase
VIAPARLAAYEVLRAVSREVSDLSGALAQVRSRLDDERDRALAGEIATGTLRWQGAFDHIIATFATRPVARLDPEVLDILRLTTFQLLHLDRIPASAAVNDAVALTGKVGKRSASGLVNAILRRINRERDHLPLPARPYQPADKAAAASASTDVAIPYLEKTLSHPRWLIERWLDRYGFDAAERWAIFDNSPAALTVRTNTLRISREALAERLGSAGITTVATRFATHGLVIVDGNPLATSIAAEGLFFIQDEASQLVAELVGATAGERILDACAAPGGKTTAMAAAMNNRGLIVATDLRGRRVDLLARTIGNLGAACARVVRADAAAVLPFRAAFDAVLLDTPCSGLGTLRRDPDIRWRRSPDELADLAVRQLQMLHRASAVVAPGGRIIYATCSSEPEEDEEVVARFLSAHPEFRLAGDRIPSRLTGFATRGGHFRTLPFRDELEAFFAAILVKTKDLR